MFSCFSFFLLQGRSGLLLAPICVHFRHRARGMLPYLRCWFVNFRAFRPSPSGVPFKGTKYSTSKLCRNSSGIVPVRVGKPIVQVRIPTAVNRAVVQVARAKNGSHCAVSPVEISLIVTISYSALKGEIPSCCRNSPPAYAAALRPQRPQAERRAAKIQSE